MINRNSKRTTRYIYLTGVVTVIYFTMNTQDTKLIEIWYPEGFDVKAFIPYGESPMLIQPYWGEPAAWDKTSKAPRLVIEEGENVRAKYLMTMLKQVYPAIEDEGHKTGALVRALGQYFRVLEKDHSPAVSKPIDADEEVNAVIESVNAVNREFSSWNRYSGHDQEGAARHNADVDRWRAYAHQMQILDYIAKGFGDNNQRDRALYELILAMLPEEVMQEVIKSKRAALFNK